MDPQILLAYLNIVLSLLLTGLALLMLRYFRHGRIHGPFFWILASAGAFTTHTLGYQLSEIFGLFSYETAVLLNNMGHAVALLFLTIGMFQLARIWGRPPRRLTVAQGRNDASSTIPKPSPPLSPTTNASERVEQSG